MEPFHRDINELLKIKYKYNGTDPKEGLNCFTFILYYFNKLSEYESLQLPNFEPNWWTKEELIDLFYMTLLKLFRSAILYDGTAYPTRLYENQVLGFSKYDEYRKITHIGIYIGDKKFIHCCEKKGVVISNLSTIMKIKIVGDIE